MNGAVLDSWENTRIERCLVEASTLHAAPVAMLADRAKAGPDALEVLEVQAHKARVQQQLFGEDAEPAPTMGRFSLVRRIGSGAMGVVFEGYDPALDRRVALKVLRSEIDAEPSLQARTRMMREAQALARLRHPNVTMVYEVGTTDEGAPFIAMELVEGRTLKKWLRSRPRSSPEIVEVFLQAGRGLAAAHEAGLVHRDFKPDNVLVDEDGQARVVDFGLARTAGQAEFLPTLDESGSAPVALQLTCTGALLGTPAYMAPEQFDGRPAGAACDQFSFCVALFEALYGRRPYPGNDLPSLQRSLVDGAVVGPRRGVPRRLYRVLRRGLSTDASQRYPSMDALLDALQACQRRPRGRRTALLVASLALATAAGSLLQARASAPEPTVASTAPVVAPVTGPADDAVPVVARAGVTSP